MVAEYKRDVNHNYLILHGEGEVDTASYQVRILAGNVVPSLLKCRLQGLDGKVLFYYEITSRQSVSQAFEGKKLSLEDVQLIFSGFVRIMEEMTEHLLNPAQLVLDPNYMYMDAEKKELHFCCLPGYDKGVREQFQTLTEYLLPKLDHEDGGAVMLGYSVYRRAMEDSFHLEYIKEELYRIRDGAAAEALPEMKMEAPRAEAEELWEEACGSLNGNSGGEERKYSERGRYRYKNEINSNKRKKITKKDGINRNNEKKSGLFEVISRYKVYIAGYSLFTVGIVALFSANLLGYLPWLRAEWILGGALVCMALGGLVCYFLERRKKKTETPWRERVRENMQNAQQQTLRGVTGGACEMREGDPAGCRSEFVSCRDDPSDRRGDLAGRRGDLVGSKEELVGCRDDLAGHRKKFIGRRDEIAGYRDESAGVREDLADCRGNQAGVRDNLAGCRGNQAGVRDDLAGCRGNQAGGREDLAGCRGSQVGVRDAPVDRRGSLADRVYDFDDYEGGPAGCRNAVDSRKDRSGGQRGRFGDQKSAPAWRKTAQNRAEAVPDQAETVSGNIEDGAVSLARTTIGTDCALGGSDRATEWPGQSVWGKAAEQGYRKTPFGMRKQVGGKAGLSDRVAEDFGETVVLSAREDTGPASLVSREPGELATIYLEEELTVIGKLAAACDAVIPLPTVSRVHARIRKREDEYFLTDLNSRNGTAVNGRMLKGDEEYMLQDEDEVDIAQARYIFLK